MSKKKYACPVCGAIVLKNPPYDENGTGSDEICARCKFECNDFSRDGALGLSIEEYRRKWLKKKPLPKFLKKAIYKNRLKAIDVEVEKYMRLS